MEKTIKIKKEIYNNILNTLGNEEPEAGGILGWRKEIISEYYYDGTAKKILTSIAQTSLLYIPYLVRSYLFFS
ncbi:MAG TPA: hypothetical protein DCE60_03815 [Coprococcus sp.]|nr:hypothetical protein [Coprococcus sp.]